MTWSNVSEPTLQLLWNATWQSALLAAIVVAVVHTVGRWITPAWRVALYAIPLLRLVVLVLPVSSFSLFQWVERPYVQMTRDTSLSGARISVPFPTRDDRPIQAAAAQTLVLSKSGESVQTDPVSGRMTATQIAVAVWMIGVVLLSFRWLVSAVALRRLLLRGEVLHDGPLKVTIEQCCRDARIARRVTGILTDVEIGPATCGLFHPKVVISKELTRQLAREELQIIIAHEVEHIRRCDCLVQSLGRLATTMHWYNPLAHVLRRWIQREIELAVDASTLGKLGPSRATMYGQLLIRIAARSRPSLGMVAMASRRGNLRHRIDHLMNWQQPRRRQVLLGAATAISLALVGLSGTERPSAAAQESAKPTRSSSLASDTADTEEGNAAKEQLRASGRVIDAGGNPVAGAILMAQTYTANYEPETVSAKSDDNGLFSISFPPFRHQFEMYHTWAYAEGHSVRVVMMGKLLADGKIAENVEIQLPPLETSEFRVQLPDGQPCADALVSPWYVDIPNGAFAADEPTGLSGFVPDDLKSMFTQRTDAEGRVKIKSIPKALLGSVQVEATPYGRQHFRPPSETLQLAEVGKISGVVATDSLEPFAGKRIYLSTSHSRSNRQDLEGLADVQIDESGRFEVAAIAPGTLRIGMTWDSEAELYPLLPENLLVEPDKTLRVTIETRRTIPVTGRVLTADTRQPVSGARVSLGPEIAGRIRVYAYTDADGRYTVRLPSGKFRRQVISLGSTEIASNYNHPRLDPGEIPADANTFESDDILLNPMRLVKGVLQDADGNPMAGTTVVMHTGSHRHLAGRSTTGADGRFEMRVRNWDVPGFARSRRYWATLDQPAVGADPPQFTKLQVLDDNPDALQLRRPSWRRLPA